MSLQQATKPTDAGETAAFDAPLSRTRIEYFRAYQQAVQSPNWVVNLLWGMLAIFSSGVIPIVGPMVWTGYTYECVARLALSRGQVFPDFDVNRFGDYLTRGVWPFLVQLLIWVAVWATWFCVYIGLFVVIGSAAAAGDQYAPIVLAVGFPLLALALATVTVVPMVLLAPLMLRAGLTQDLSSTVNLAWWGDFLRRVGLETAISTLFILLTGAILMTLGCLLVLVGSYVAWAWVTMASAHLSWQLYELYLARGGEPVPIQPPRVSPPPYAMHYPPATYPPANYPQGGYVPPAYPPSPDPGK